MGWRRCGMPRRVTARPSAVERGLPVDDPHTDDPAPLSGVPSRRQFLGTLATAAGLGAVLVLAGCGGGGDDEEGDEGEEEDEEDD